MSRVISLNARTAHDQVASSEVEVVLTQFTHPETEQIIRLSTDPTDRISYAPLRYGTRSNWLGADPTDDEDAFKFVLMGVQLPDDEEASPPAARFVLDAVDASMAETLTSATQQAEVSIAVVLASTPNVIEQEWRGFALVNSEGAGGRITLSITRDPKTAEPWPAGRMTRERFPGLHP